MSLHCPLTADTKGLIGADKLARMKQSVLLINTARGGVVDSAALAEALAKLSPADAEKQLAQMTDDDYELFLLGFGPDTAKLKQTHFISYLFNRKNEESFHIFPGGKAPTCYHIRGHF